MLRRRIFLMILIISAAAAIKSYPSCKPNVSKKYMPLIHYGQNVEEGAFPWIATLSFTKDDKFFCSGVLVSETKVLTAAHCLLSKDSTLNLKINDFVVTLGAHNISYVEPSAIKLVPKKIDIHPDWLKPMSYEADIAIIHLDRVELGTRIAVICIIDNIEPSTTEGTVVGYGQDETNSITTVPMQIKVPLISNEQCYQLSELRELVTNRTFCAGARNMTGPCVGDSGGGLFVLIGNTFYLYGLVSHAKQAESSCDLKEFILYTKVGAFLSMINSETTSVLPDGENICGKSSKANSLIQGGHFSENETWPWTVAVFIVDMGREEYRTSGSLITAKHVLTSAISVSIYDGMTSKFSPRSLDSLTLYFGMVDLDVASASSSIILERLQKITIHPSMTYGLPHLFNIAIITLKQTLELSVHVQPICLTSNTFKIENSVGTLAFAAGWGQDESGKVTRKLKHTQMRIADDVYCKRVYRKELENDNTSRFFCARGIKGTACRRDDVLYLKIQDRWYLVGISALSKNLNSGICSKKLPLAYENISIFYEWINSQINRNYDDLN